MTRATNIAVVVGAVGAGVGAKSLTWARPLRDKGKQHVHNGDSEGDHGLAPQGAAKSLSTMVMLKPNSPRTATHRKRFVHKGDGEADHCLAQQCAVKSSSTKVTVKPTSPRMAQTGKECVHKGDAEADHCLAP